MRGTIEPRGQDRWRVRAFAARQDGKVRWVSRTVHGGKRATQSALAKLVAEVEGGQVVAGHPITLGELLDRWLDDVEPRCSAYTLHEYRRVAERNIKRAIGGVRLDKLDARQLDDFYRALKRRRGAASPSRSRGRQPGLGRRHSPGGRHRCSPGRAVRPPP